MAWTAPRTWVSGELVTAGGTAGLNPQLRDNLLALDGGRLAITSQAAGDLVYASSSTALARLAADNAKFLKSGSAAPAWRSASDTFADISPLTTRGDVLVGTSGTATGARLAVGGASTYLTSDGTDVSWGSVTTSVTVLNKTSDYTCTTSDCGDNAVILTTSSSGNVTITLYSASSNNGKIIQVKKMVAANSVVVDGSGAETIDGNSTITITAQYYNLTLCCDGSNWHIL